MGIHYPPAPAPSSSVSFPADDPTAASSTNSRGDQICVCFQLREPPQPSRLFLWWPGGTRECDRFSVVGAHRDAVLLQMAYLIPVPNHEYHKDMFDYFLYRTGGGSPSVVLLPSLDGTMVELRDMCQNGTYKYTNQCLRRIEGMDIDVLRRGAGDVVVAELQIVGIPEPELHLHVLFPPMSASSKWIVKKPRIVHGPDLDLDRFLWHWSADMVVPFESYLCWADFCQGAILLCKMFDKCKTPF